MHTDNGPQFTSKEFREFCNTYGISHSSSSPHYPRSNGLAEKTVQTLKKILTKAKQNGCDPYLSVLDYRNTPIVGDASPAQLLFGRRTKTTLPTSSSLLAPHLQDPANIKAKLIEKQQTQKYYYDRTAKPLPVLEEGDVVRMKNDSTKGEWKKAVVVAPRSYLVEDTNGQLYRRNRQHLVKTRDYPMPAGRKSDFVYLSENLDNVASNDSTGHLYGNHNNNAEVQPLSEIMNNSDVSINDVPEIVRTRSGRVINKPEKLDL